MKKENIERDYYKSIFANYYSYLCKISCYYIGRRDCAEDIVQDVIISFWDKLTHRGFKPNGEILPYLKGAVVNQSLKYIRNNHIIICDTEKEIIENKEDYDLNDDAKKEKLLIELKELLDTLSPQCRLVFDKIVFENKSYKLVAQELNISVNSVKTHQSRALKKIRKNNKLLFIFILINLG